MYRTIAQLDLVTQQLAQSFPQQCTRIQLPEASVQGRPVHALRLRAGTGEGRRGVLLLGGVHARELMNPDMLVELAVHLVTSYRNGTDLVLGARVWSSTEAFYAGRLYPAFLRGWEGQQASDAGVAGGTT